MRKKLEREAFLATKMRELEERGEVGSCSRSGGRSVDRLKH